MTTTDQLQNVAFVDLVRQYDGIRSEIRTEIEKVLDRGDFILGEAVSRFEAEFAAYCEVSHGIGVDSGTSALELCLLALDVGPGDEVITTANTFIATALAISSTGATPVFIDIEPNTYAMDTSLLEDAITARTRAIIPVHLYGLPADMDEIMDVAKRHELSVVEDASQAHGARYRTRRVGSLGHMAAFSLYPSKNLGAFGDAGIVVTNDEALAEKVRLLRNYGSRVKYQHAIKGFNRRLDTLQAAVLGVKLRHLDDWNVARRSHAERYGTLLDRWSESVVLPRTPSDVEHVFHAYVIRTDFRDDLQRYLAKSGVSTVIHYPTPIHRQPAFMDLGYAQGDYPITEAFAGQILSLPMFAELTANDIEHVADSIGRHLVSPDRAIHDKQELDR